VSLGFGYHFSAIDNETNELFCAYKEMFEIAISQGQKLRDILVIYFPILDALWVSSKSDGHQQHSSVDIP
jgi:hypothetical protein